MICKAAHRALIAPVFEGQLDRFEDRLFHVLKAADVVPLHLRDARSSDIHGSAFPYCLDGAIHMSVPHLVLQRLRLHHGRKPLRESAPIAVQA